MDKNEKLLKVVKYLLDQPDQPDYIKLGPEYVEGLRGDDFFDLVMDLTRHDCYDRNVPGNPPVEEGSFGFYRNELDFNALYRLMLKLKNEYQRPFIKSKTLEQIAKRFGDRMTANEIIALLEECEVPHFLILYPNTKWRMVQDVFISLASSTKPSDKILLFSIFEEFCHPVYQGGNEKRSQEEKDFITSLIQYDGYCFRGNHISEASESDVASFKARQLAQRKETEEALTFGAFSDLFGGSQKFISPVSREASPVHQPVNVTINNSNVQNSDHPMSRVHQDEMLRLEKEKTRVARVQASGKPEIIHQLDKIIQTCRLQRGKEKIEIDFRLVDFEDNLMGGIRDGRRFITLLAESGAFETYEFVANYYAVVSGVNLEKLGEYRHQMHEEFILDEGREKVHSEGATKMTEDGRLLYQHKSISDLTGDQYALSEFLCSEKVGHNFNTLTVEEKVYGEDRTDQSENLRKLVERVNKRAQEELGIEKFIRYSTRTIQRLV